MSERLTAEAIIEAWYSVTDRWFTRRNKAHDERQWEVVHDWGGDLISDKTMKVVGRFETGAQADHEAQYLQDAARAEAVLSAIKER